MRATAQLAKVRSPGLTGSSWYTWSDDGFVGRVLKIGLQASLFLSLFDLPVRYVIGSRVAGAGTLFAIQLLLFLFVVMIALISKPLRFMRYDVIVALFLLYGVFHVALPLGWGERPLFVIRELRTYFFDFLLYFVVRYYLQRTRNFAMLYRWLRLIVLIACAEYLYELIGILVLRVPAEVLIPWISVLAEVSDVEWVDKGQWYFPTLFAKSHAVGMLATVGVVLFYARYKLARRRWNLVAMVFCFFVVLAVASRVFVAALMVVTLGLVLGEREGLGRRLLVIAVGLMVAIAIVGVAAGLMDDGRAFLELYWENMTSQTSAFFEFRDEYVNFVPTLNGGISENVFYYLFGTGANELFEQVEALRLPIASYGYHGIEIRLFGVVLQYGLLYLLLWAGLATLTVEVAADWRLRIYGWALIPFFGSMIHYLEVFKVTIFPTFLVLYAALATASETGSDGFIVSDDGSAENNCRDVVR